MRVLIVDDDPEIRLIASFLLRNAGHEVAEAASGHDAEATLKSDSFDLVLMDVMLGDDDGVELAERLLPADAGTTHLVFLTGAVREEQVARMHAAGATGIVHKPFDPTTFVERVHGIIGGHG